MQFADLLEETRAKLKDYWSHASGELDTHTEKTLAQILAILTDFAQAAEGLLNVAEKKQAFDQFVAYAFERLHALNEEHDGGLLETDEREMIGPLFDGVAAALGIDPGLYEGQDVTYPVRDF